MHIGGRCYASQFGTSAYRRNERQRGANLQTNSQNQEEATRRRKELHAALARASDREIKRKQSALAHETACACEHSLMMLEDMDVATDIPVHTSMPSSLSAESYRPAFARAADEDGGVLRTARSSLSAESYRPILAADEDGDVFYDTLGNDGPRNHPRHVSFAPEAKECANCLAPE